MNHSTRRFTHGVRRTLLAALALTALGTTAAWATPTTITQWSFSISSQFDTTQTVFQGCADPNSCQYTSNGATTLSWGYKQETPSSLVIDPATSMGSINTYVGNPPGPATDSGIVLTHNNNPINSDAHELTDAVLSTQVWFTPTTPPIGSQQGPFSLDLNIHFKETPNSTPCTAPSPKGNPCNDIFVVDTSSLETSFSYDPDGNGALTYYVSLFPTVNGVLNPLSVAECAAAGVASTIQNPCFGFTTVEGKSTPMDFGLSIATKPQFIETPEPGILGMMGLGLLGIGLGGYALRRRKLSVHH